MARSSDAACGTGYQVIHAIEGQRPTELATGDPRGAGNGAMVALAGGIDHGVVAGFLEVVGRDQPAIATRAGGRNRNGAGSGVAAAGGICGLQVDGIAANTVIGVRWVLRGASATVAESPVPARDSAARHGRRIIGKLYL